MTAINDTLTERYVSAAMRTVPDDQRADLEAELRASIQDLVDARTEAGEQTTVAEAAVLTDLGDPELLAASYTDRKLYLIGPRYYLMWWRLLKVLLWIIPACAALGVAIAQTLLGSSIGEIIAEVVVIILSVIMHVTFWTTLVFFILDRTDTPTGDGRWSVADLPEIRQTGAGATELVASLVFLVLGTGAIAWDHFVGFVPAQPGLSFFGQDLWPWWALGLLVLFIFEAVYSVALYRAGRVTLPLAWANAVLAVLFMSLLLTALGRGLLLNPDFFITIIPSADSAATVTTIVSVLVAFGVVTTSVWDIWDGFRKATR
ncbi:permease prefix domain 1-containing protein [Pseudoclavibacter terrae]|uniref:permease prefix domain 1-containing protein n=1 Tax=Pseudoclavibacter terrae TaxID=1530195 RepID=UPI00232F2D96|nr:permease prefix domain 1-containing protein [Pseudoclavibacter terrae]